MPDSGPVALPLRCQFCGKAMTVLLADWGAQASESHWDCPSCRKPNSGPLNGRVVEVRAGYRNQT